MTEIVFAQTGDALEQVITLSQEYVNWMLSEIRLRYPELDINEFTSEHTYDDVRKKFPGEHILPDGFLLIARTETDVCGCVALGRLDATTCEMRTLYVRPAFRGLGIGKQLAEASLNEARKLGYRCVRLDTLRFMESAFKLYSALGFYPIPPYLDMSEALKGYIRFLELAL